MVLEPVGFANLNAEWHNRKTSFVDLERRWHMETAISLLASFAPVHAVSRALPSPVAALVFLAEFRTVEMLFCFGGPAQNHERAVVSGATRTFKAHMHNLTKIFV
jgi:hypothetical protein